MNLQMKTKTKILNKDVKFKETKAITLISLIITIVIMLILATVSINLIIGDNGLFKKSSLSSQKYKEASDNEQNELNNVSDEIDNLTIEPLKDVKQLIVEVKGPIGSTATASTINEIDIYNAKNEKINYSLSETEAYDSDSSDSTKVPHYWNLTNNWDKTALNDNDATYNQSGACSLCYMATHNDDEYTRFLITLDNEEDLSKLRVNFGDGSRSGESPKEVSVYRVIKYSEDNLTKKSNKGLVLLGTKQFTEEVTEPTWFDIFYEEIKQEPTPDQTPETFNQLIIEVKGPIGSTATASTINELQILNSSNAIIPYTVSQTEVYDSDSSNSNKIPYYWYTTEWGKKTLNDNEATYSGATACSICYISNHTDDEFTRFLITLNSNDRAAKCKVNFGDSSCYMESPKEVSVYRVKHYSSNTYTNNIAKRDNTGLELLGRKSFTEEARTPTWYNVF